MKTIIFSFVFVLISAFSYGRDSISGNSNTAMGDFTITAVDANLYQLNYANGAATFTIEVCHNPNECCYLLRGKTIELMYQCNKLGFGMRKMPEKFKQMETKEYGQLIDPATFQQQSQLTPKKKSEKEALALIASFFPAAINAESQSKVFETSSLVAKR